MVSYTSSLTRGLIQPSSMSYVAYSFAEDVTLAWPSSFSNSAYVAAAIMDLTATTEALKVILPDARSVSVGQNLLINNRGEQDFAVGSRNEAGEIGNVIPKISLGQSFYIYLSDNSKPQGNWNVIPFGAGSVVVTSVSSQSDDPDALSIGGSPVTGAGTFLFKLSQTLKSFSAFTKQGLAVLTAQGWEGRTVQAGQNIALKNGDGAQGDPVIATTEDVAFKNATINTLKIAELTSLNPEAKKQPIPVTALQTQGNTSFLTGWDEDYIVHEVTYGNKGKDIWKLPTQTTDRGDIGLYGLSDILNAQEQGSLNLLPKMTPPKVPCVIGGTTTQGGSFYEMALTAWQIPTLRDGNNGPTGVDFSTLWEAQTNETLSGAKLQKNSLPLQTLQNLGRCAPFAMGWVSADGKLYTGFNVDNISHSPDKPGQYYISFQTVASSKNYVVLVTPYYNAAQGIHAEPQVTAATYFSVFCSANQSPEDFIDNSFFFGVWDF